MTFSPQHISARTYHGRQGRVKNAFRYSVDYVLVDPEQTKGPVLFSRNRTNLLAVHDKNHGGRPGQGSGVAWARRALAEAGLPDVEKHQILLLTQPSFIGYTFNPVSFWLVMDKTELRAVIAEVNNTFGDRHSYVCYNPGFTPIAPQDRIVARKVFHVSPFQDIAGDYRFNFDVEPDQINIRIEHRSGTGRMVATLAGHRTALTNRIILMSVLRRPLGSLRTTFLIHWQALRLKLKGARYRSRPAPPERDVS